MRIKKYDILLTILREEDIELVREKRNSEAIKSKMHYREIITPEMQKAWFRSIHNAPFTGETASFYFIIHYKNEKIGLVNGKNVDPGSRSSEGGLFLWATEYWGTIVPVMVSLITLDFNFFLNNFSNNYIKILRSNSNAIFYNKQLGYEPVDDPAGDDEYQYYVLTKEKYLLHAKKLRRSIGILTNDFEPLALSDIDFDDAPDEELTNIFPYLTPFEQETMKKILVLNGRKVNL